MVWAFVALDFLMIAMSRHVFFWLTALFASAVQAQGVAPLPSDAAPAVDMNLLHLVMEASIPVKLVMLLLLLASVVSIYLIVKKSGELSRAKKGADEFEEEFWSGTDLSALYRDLNVQDSDDTGLPRIFEAGFREFTKLKQKRNLAPSLVVESAQRAMRTQTARSLDKLENNLEVLANIGSISPYVGLFGTVWGIMFSFQGLAQMKEATIATVAPGISEALIATAMGLFAAIPAVWAYNRFATRVDRLGVRYEGFVDEMTAILERHAHADS